MNLMIRVTDRSPCQGVGVACVVVLLCLCVVTQMLGMPATLVDLLNTDVLTKSEPVSEDFSTPSLSPEPERPRLFNFFSELRPVVHLPVLLTSVFHPPSA